MNSGIRKTTTGNMLRTSTAKNRMSRPGNWNRENAYAAGIAIRTPSTVVLSDTIMLFKK